MHGLETSSEVQDGIKRLLDPRKSPLSVSVWMYDPMNSRRPSWPSKRPKGGRETPLDDGAFYGMLDIAAFLIVELQDVDSRSSDSKRTQDKNDFTALVRAAKWGNVEIAGVLQEHGTNVNARGMERRTPL